MVIDMNYWTKVFRKIVILILSLIGIYLGFKLAVFYLPFLIAFILSLFLEPLIRKMMRVMKLPRKLSSIIIFILVLGILIALLVWGIATLITEGSNLLGGLNGYFEKAVAQIEEWSSYFDLSKIKVPETVTNAIQNSILDFLGNASIWIKNILTSILGMITSLPTIGVYTVVTLLSLYFICTDRIYMLDQLEHHLPEIWVKKIGKHIKELVKSLGGYLKAQATLIFISFIISLIGLYIFHFMKMNVPYPLLAAIGIGFVDALPIFGSGTIMIPWVALLAFDGDITLAIAILALWAIMSIIRQFLEPRIVGNEIGIHPIFTLIAMYTGFKLIGILGMLIGPIILVILKNIFATIIDKGVMKVIFERE